jgi:hypothetical protein
MNFDDVLVNIAIKYNFSFKAMLKIVLDEKQITPEQLEHYLRNKLIKDDCKFHRINIFCKKDIIECYQCNKKWNCNECLNSNRERYYKYQEKEFYQWKEINCSECNIKYYELICNTCNRKHCKESCSIFKKKLLNYS